jgi:hypothetical protein
LALGLAAALSVAAAAAQAAEPLPPLEIRAEGSFPLQYSQTTTSTARQTGDTIAPFGALSATGYWPGSWSTSVFASAGHDPLGRFRDNDNTFANFGANIVKRWGAFLTGASVERTRFYSGSFAETSNIANDTNLFARYYFRPGPDLRITPALFGTMRVDDAFVVQRTSLGVSFDIEQRLFGAWWFIAVPRLRYSTYVGDEAGRRDVSISTVAGLRYRFNEHVSFTTLAGAESRMSTVADRRRERFIAGVSLDFDIDLLRR